MLKQTECAQRLDLSHFPASLVSDTLYAVGDEGLMENAGPLMRMGDAR
jgi:hypothetical protein